ncbi:MAG TPA: SDR family oxidoreductase [Enhygromyxa sp.]|nr:SDR family oxidoreductase [Enhygromyxa sp.]
MDRKLMVVTGASRGLGRSLVETMLARGHRVFGCSRSQASIEHPEYTHFELDVADEPAVVRMFKAVRKTGEPLYALINNAGAAAMNHALLTPAATMTRLLAINVQGTMLCSREAAKQMSKHRVGRIINFSTIAAAYDLEGEAVYVASKSAVAAYSRVLARELGERGVTVNVVAPNPIRTALIAGVPDDKLQAILARQAIKRFGRFEDVLNVVDFFLDPRSEFVTGQIIYLGGP